MAKCSMQEQESCEQRLEQDLSVMTLMTGLLRDEEKLHHHRLLAEETILRDEENEIQKHPMVSHACQACSAMQDLSC